MKNFEKMIEKTWETDNIPQEIYNIPNNVRNTNNNYRCSCCCRGRPGPMGPIGPEGPAGVCECSCAASGELILNGSMENIADGRPTTWTTTTPALIESVSAAGRVHTGDYSTAMQNGAVLEQSVDINGGCYYELSFFANVNGNLVGVTAEVSFVTPSGTTAGARIVVNQQNLTNESGIFAFYKILTVQAPNDATNAIISFTVSAGEDQYAYIDDVSFSVQ